MFLTKPQYHTKELVSSNFYKIREIYETNIYC